MMPLRFATCSVAAFFAAVLVCGGCRSANNEPASSRGAEQLRSALAQSDDSIVGGRRDANSGGDARAASAGDADRSELISKIEDFLARTQEFDSGEAGAQPARRGAASEPAGADRVKRRDAATEQERAASAMSKPFVSAPPRSRAAANSGDAWHRRPAGGDEAAVRPGAAEQTPASGSSGPSSRSPAVTVRTANQPSSARDVSYGPAIPIIESVRIREPDGQSSAVSVRSGPGGGTASRPLADERTRRVQSPSSMTNQSLGANPPRGPATLGDVLPQLEKRAEDRGDFDAMWKLSLTKLASGADPTALPPGNGLSEQSDVVLRSFAMLGREVRDALVDPRADGTGVVSALEGLRESMLVRLDPVISTMALCTKVTTFGVYEPLPPEALVAGRPVHAVVYSEIDHLASERGVDGKYASRLATRLELFTADGESLWHQQEPEIRDECSRRRRDFFVAQRMTLPPTLPAGEYVLKLTVEDLASGRMTERAHPVRLDLAESVVRSSGMLP